MRSFESKGDLPKNCELAGVTMFAIFLDRDQQEYLVPIEEIPDLPELKEAILRNKVYGLLEAEEDYEMVQRILSTVGACLI